MTMTTADLPAVAAVADDGAVSPRAARPRRRSFTAVYKLRTLAEYEAAQPGERTNRPCAMNDVYAAYQAEAPAQRAAAIQAREVGRAVLHGDAHQQCGTSSPTGPVWQLRAKQSKSALRTPLTQSSSPGHAADDQPGSTHVQSMVWPLGHCNSVHRSGGPFRGS